MENKTKEDMLLHTLPLADKERITRCIVACSLVESGDSAAEQHEAETGID